MFLFDLQTSEGVPLKRSVHRIRCSCACLSIFVSEKQRHQISEIQIEAEKINIVSEENMLTSNLDVIT